MALELYSSIAVDHVQIVLRICDKTNTVRIAGCLSDQFSIASGEIKNVNFFLDTSALVEDRYTFSIEVITQNASGQYHSYDNPGTAFPISLINSDDSDVLWPTVYWSNVRLGHMPISEG